MSKKSENDGKPEIPRPQLENELPYQGTLIKTYLLPDGNVVSVDSVHGQKLGANCLYRTSEILAKRQVRINLQNSKMKKLEAERLAKSLTTV